MLIVEKYGGSSISTLNKIKNIAKHIKKSVQQKNKLVVVVSAMGKTTNKLLSISQKITKFPNKRELDVLLSTGETKSASLLSLTLNEQKVKALSLCGFQAKIKTSSDFGKAFIKDIDITKIKNLLKKFDVIVVAGFQGIDCHQNITTLGRGGSDTTAVALASKLKCPCHIFSDVESIFMANPNHTKNPKPIHKISINLMLEMAGAGAKVLDTRCLEIAKKFSTQIFLGKSLEENHKKGSFVLMKDNFEEPKVLAVCEKNDLTLFEIKGENVEQKILQVLKKENQNLFMFLKNFDTLCFAIAKNESQNIEKILKNILKNAKIKTFENFCEISLVGFGFSTHPNLSEKMFQKLFENKIFVHQISISETKISIMVQTDYSEKTLEILSKLFKVTK